MRSRIRCNYMLFTGRIRPLRQEDVDFSPLLVDDYVDSASSSEAMYDFNPVRAHLTRPNLLSLFYASALHVIRPGDLSIYVHSTCHRIDEQGMPSS